MKSQEIKSAKLSRRQIRFQVNNNFERFLNWKPKEQTSLYAFDYLNYIVFIIFHYGKRTHNYARRHNVRHGIRFYRIILSNSRGLIIKMRLYCHALGSVEVHEFIEITALKKESQMQSLLNTAKSAYIGMGTRTLCTLHEKNVQITINILRKTVLNVVRTYLDNFLPRLNMVNVMRKCLLDTDFLLDVIHGFDSCFDNVTN